MIYDSKAVTVEEFCWLVSGRWKLFADGWEQLPDQDDQTKPMRPVNGVVYLRRRMLANLTQTPERNPDGNLH